MYSSFVLTFFLSFNFNDEILFWARIFVFTFSSFILGLLDVVKRNVFPFEEISLMMIAKLIHNNHNNYRKQYITEHSRSVLHYYVYVYIHLKRLYILTFGRLDKSPLCVSNTILCITTN